MLGAVRKREQALVGDPQPANTSIVASTSREPIPAPHSSGVIDNGPNKPMSPHRETTLDPTSSPTA